MSGTDDTCPMSLIPEAEVAVYRTGFYQIATAFVLWGLQIALACQAVHLLWQRGLRHSLSRSCLCAIVLVMLGSCTTSAMLNMEFYIVQLPWIGQETPPPEIIYKLKVFNLTMNWMTRLNFCLSDIVVVWRAWALWPGKKSVRVVLALFMGGTLACTTANVVLITVQHFRSQNPSSPGHLYPPSTLRSLLYIPLLVTNALATALICWKAWLHRKEIQRFANMGSSGSTKVSPSVSGSTVRVGRVFALFIETGVIYIVFFILMMVGSFGVFDKTEASQNFYFVWGEIMDASAGIYPTVIIILVSKYMSQSEVIHSSNHYAPSSRMPNSNEYRDSDERNGTLSTIRFDTPQVGTAGTMSSDTYHERIERGRSFDREKPVGLAV